MIKVNVLVQEKKWKKYLVDPKKYLEIKLRKIKFSEPLLKDKKMVFSVLLGGNKEIKSLNRKFRKKNKTTDVLSFPFYKDKTLKEKLKFEKNTYLGDIVLNLYKINGERKKDFFNNFNQLWIHGFLHLIGYKHSKNRDFYKMNKLENKLLNQIKM